MVLMLSTFNSGLGINFQFSLNVKLPSWLYVILLVSNEMLA